MTGITNKFLLHVEESEKCCNLATLELCAVGSMLYAGQTAKAKKKLLRKLKLDSVARRDAACIIAESEKRERDNAAIIKYQQEIEADLKAFEEKVAPYKEAFKKRLEENYAEYKATVDAASAKCKSEFEAIEE